MGQFFESSCGYFIVSGESTPCVKEGAESARDARRHSRVSRPYRLRTLVSCSEAAWVRHAVVTKKLSWSDPCVGGGLVLVMYFIDASVTIKIKVQLLVNNVIADYFHYAKVGVLIKYVIFLTLLCLLSSTIIIKMHSKYKTNAFP